MTREACAADAIGMSYRKRAAVDVQALVRNAEAITAIQHLASECFIELPQIDIADSITGTVEQPRDRVNRTHAHFVGLATGHRKAAKQPQGVQAAPLGEFALHDDAGAAAVGELARVARRDDAARQWRPALGPGFARRI